MSELKNDIRSVDSKVKRWRVVTATALAVAILALITSCYTSQNPHGGFFGIGASASCTIATPGPSGSPGKPGSNGLSAYDLWRQLGHTGTVQDFLNSLIGEKGKDGTYTGSNGLNGKTGAAGASGAAGQDGASAYQLWLDAGNTGTEDDFLLSLVGPMGTQGIGGLSAYELWELTHPGATEQDFFDSLVGATGTDGENGTDGLNGQSAYELWLETNPGKTETEFLASLKGDPGEAGICADGVDGINGVDGASAYQIWLAQGNTGTVETFLASLIGPAGPAGPQGETGATGATGPKGDKGDPGAAGGYYLSVYDTTIQKAMDPTSVFGLTFNTVVDHNGITLDNSTANRSIIRFAHSGEYNVQYSIQWINQNTAKDYNANVWIRVNGVDVPDSSTYSTVPQKHETEDGALVTAVNYVLHFSAGDELEFMWWNQDEDGDMFIGTVPASTLPVMPASPAIIMTITQVG